MPAPVAPSAALGAATGGPGRPLSRLPWRRSTPPPSAHVAACVPCSSSGCPQFAPRAAWATGQFWHVCAAVWSSACAHSGLGKRAGTKPRGPECVLHRASGIARVAEGARGPWPSGPPGASPA
eukprot:7639074-Pyramimonas_sp.AAC.1